MNLSRGMQKNIFQRRMDVNTISSVYERNVANLVKEAIAQENSGDIGVYYAKKEALTLPVAGVQFPIQLQQSIASNGIVHRFSEKVNMKISEPYRASNTTKYNKNITKQEAIVLIDELVATSQYQRSEPAKHTHGWLDNNGKNSWELWTTYIQDRDNVIWKASLNVATATDGKRYLYDIPKIKKLEQPGERRAHLPPTATVAQQGQNVNQKHSREAGNR